MAKRKLYGAALAAHQKRIGRSSSTALARRPSQAMATRPKARKVYIKVKAKRRSGGAMTRGGGGGGVNGAIASLKAQTWDLGAGVGYGYLSGSDSLKAVELRKNTLDHLPTSAKLGKPLSHGLVLTGAAALLPPGMLRKAVGHLAHAALMRAAHNLGVAGGDTDAFAAMAGDGDGGDFSGAIDVDADAD